MDLIRELYLAWQDAESDFQWASTELFRLAVKSDTGCPSEAQFAQTRDVAARARRLHERYDEALQTRAIAMSICPSEMAD